MCLPCVTWLRNWDPDFPCRFDTKVGIGDGGKWVCDPLRIAEQSRRRMEQYKKQEGKASGNEVQAGCIVYSVGSNGDFRFEVGLAALLSGACEIHTFDFTNYSHNVPHGKSIFFHPWGLKPSYNETEETGHMQRVDSLDARSQACVARSRTYR
jgi:hypothetical protein